MSSGDDEHDPEEQVPHEFPQVGSDIAWLGYHVRLEFHPSIKIVTRAGHNFASSIHSAMEAGTTDVDGSQWILRGARAYDGMKVIVSKESIALSVINPQNAQDWYEQRFTSILEVFGQIYEPKVILNANAKAHGLVDVTGDARAFLGGNLMWMQPKKLDAFKRQLHVLGVRLYFPPFIDDDGDETDWGVDVKAESWMEDPAKLYLEADADWFDSTQWKPESPRQLVSHLKMVTDFMNTRLLEFLHQPPVLGMDDDTDDGQEEQGDDDE